MPNNQLGGTVVVINATTSAVSFLLNNTNRYYLPATEPRYRYVPYHTDPIPRSSAKDPGNENVFGQHNRLNVAYAQGSTQGDLYEVFIDPEQFSFEEDLQLYLFGPRVVLSQRGKIVADGIEPLKGEKSIGKPKPLEKER